MLTLVSKDSVKIGDHFDVLCVLIACMVLEIINQMSKNQKSSLIVWNTVARGQILPAVPPTGGGGGGNRGSLPRAPSVRGPPNSPELVQILAVSDRKVRRTGIVVGCAL